MRSKSSLTKYFLPYDVYERHRKIGELIKSTHTVLDVGGGLNKLSQFCSPKTIVVANLKNSMEKSDVLIKKDRLPFAKNSFDVVTAIDVLEHVPKDERTNFLRHLYEVARERVVLSFPVGNNKHLEYEKQIQNWLKNKKKEVIYIKEHQKYGLPTTSEIKELARGFNYQIFYSGNILLNKYLFKIYMFDPNIKFIRRLVYYSKLFFNLLTNSIIFKFMSDKKFDENINRAYLVIEKNT